MSEKTNQFYMNLDTEDIRNALSGDFSVANKGAGPDVIEEFLEEEQSWVERELGTLPEDDKVLRGIIRDLVVARTMLKLAADDESRRASTALRENATARLESYDNVSGKPFQKRPNFVSNVTRRPLFEENLFRSVHAPLSDHLSDNW